MEVSRMGKSGKRQGQKLAQDHPKELFGAWVLIFGASGGVATGRAHA